MSVNFTCERLIRADHPALPGHFPGQPLVPAVLLLDTLVASASDSLQLAGAIRSLRQTRFMAPVVPNLPLYIDWQERPEQQQWRFSVRQNDQEVCRGIASTVTKPSATNVNAIKLDAINLHAKSRHLIAAAPLYQQLPHSGSMCLLDELDLSAADIIYGRARLYRDQPLLVNGCLSGWQGLEYAAQLLAGQGAHMAGALAQARVVMARRLDCHQAPVLAADQELDVSVQLVSRQSNAASCVFMLNCAGSVLADGEFTVMFS